MVGAIALGIFSIFGIGAITLFLVKHYVTRSSAKADTKAAIHETNNANLLAADADFRQDLMQRVANLEIEVKELQKAVNVEMTKNATLTAQNESLQRDNERLTEEVKELRKHREESDATIAGLRKELDELKLVVSQQHPAVEGI